MQGTHASPLRCVALKGNIGTSAACDIYSQRPSVCRQVEPSYESGAASVQCDKARLAHGLPLLTMLDWELPVIAGNDAQCLRIA